MTRRSTPPMLGTASRPDWFVSDQSCREGLFLDIEGQHWSYTEAREEI